MIKSFAILSEHHLKNNIGGAEVQADLLAQYLTKNGVKVTYLSSDIESATKYKDYNLLPLPRKKRDILPLLTEIDADVYYQRGRKKLTGITAEFCKKSNKKFVFASSMDIDCIRFKQFLRGRNGQDLGYLVKNSKKKSSGCSLRCLFSLGNAQSRFGIISNKFSERSSEEKPRN